MNHTDTGFVPEAIEAIQRIYDDPTRQELADRIESVIELLDTNPHHHQLRKERMHTPKLWVVRLRTAHEDFVILWDFTDAGQPQVHYAGSAF